MFPGTFRIDHMRRACYVRSASPVVSAGDSPLGWWVFRAGADAEALGMLGVRGGGSYLMWCLKTGPTHRVFVLR